MNPTIPSSSGRGPSPRKSPTSDAARRHVPKSDETNSQGPGKADAFADTLASSTRDREKPVSDESSTSETTEADEERLDGALDTVVAAIVSALRKLESDAGDNAPGTQIEDAPPATAQLGQLWLDALVGHDASDLDDGRPNTDNTRRKNLPAPRLNRDEGGGIFRQAVDQVRLRALSGTQIARRDVERVDISKPGRDALSGPLMHNFSAQDHVPSAEKPQKNQTKPVSAADLARELQFSRGERGTSARAVLDVGRGREVALKLRQHQGIMTVDIEASAHELSQKLIHHVQELTRSLQTLELGRGRVQVDGATVGEWTGHDQQRDDDVRSADDPLDGRRTGDDEHDDDSTINVIRHAAMTGHLHIVT